MVYCSDEKFAIWAFGKISWDKFMCYEIDSIDLMKIWNDRHGEKLRIDEADLIYESMEKMKNIWKKRSADQDNLGNIRGCL